MNCYKFMMAIAFIFVLSSCNERSDSNANSDKFDRAEMLEAWADSYIIPNLQAYVSELSKLKGKKDLFLGDLDTSSFSNLREAYISAYESWQKVAFIDIGKFEEINLLSYTNIYPTDSSTILSNISSQAYNLELPSNFDAQGFPALDFLLFGLADKIDDQIAFFHNSNYQKYLSDLVERLDSLSTIVLNDWKANFRTNFISNNGSSATASVDKLVNDFLFYFEKELRAGKIGIPAGIFSGNILSASVEAPHSGEYSRSLFLESLKSLREFFEGSGTTSLKDYLEYTATQGIGEDVVEDILAQWDEIEIKTDAVMENLKMQVEQDNIRMLELYDELQKAVVLLKVDMMQALNIQIDFVDADGD